jgi:hypothetical protein
LLINYKTGEKSDLKVITPSAIKLNYENSTAISGFVYKILEDKQNGSFIEVGSSHWKENNSTYVLEKEFGWLGVGIEIEKHFVTMYNENRESPCIHANALNFNWDEYLEKNNFGKTIDFLQIDVDDIVPNSNLLALLNIPLSRYKFNVICVEHSANIDPKYRSSREAQIEILQARGYVLVASLFTDDWWIHKSLSIPPSTWMQICNAAYRNLHDIK